jgi:hypothetical protein
MMVMSMALLVAERCSVSVATPFDTLKDNELIEVLSCLLASPPPRSFSCTIMPAGDRRRKTIRPLSCGGLQAYGDWLTFPGRL